MHKTLSAGIHRMHFEQTLAQVVSMFQGSVSPMQHLQLIMYTIIAVTFT
jgi:hypothetical protein